VLLEKMMRSSALFDSFWEILEIVGMHADALGKHEAWIALQKARLRRTRQIIVRTWARIDQPHKF